MLASVFKGRLTLGFFAPWVCVRNKMDGIVCRVRDIIGLAVVCPFGLRDLADGINKPDESKFDML